MGEHISVTRYEVHISYIDKARYVRGLPLWLFVIAQLSAIDIFTSELVVPAACASVRS